jgi:mRNA interferase RelE/StbE
MSYRVEIMPIALKELAQLPKRVRANAEARIELLAEEPRPAGAVKSVGYENAYRLRVGDWRIIYQIKDDVLLVTVFRAAHRRESYRGL